jgi:small GTP-binding protein
MTDLELINQLEKEIGKQLKEIEFDQTEKDTKNGFTTDKKGYITGLNLDEINLVPTPKTLSKFRNLKKLSLYGTRLNDISFIKGLNKLTTLDLSYNKIEDISFIEELTHLTTLYLSGNQITEISFLKSLKNLKTLDLRNNKISELPETILEPGMEINVDSHWAGSWGIFLYKNPLKIPPIEIVKKGRDAIKAYFQSLRVEENVPLNEAKLLLVGDGGAGKTSLVKQLLGQEFDTTEPQTHGINIDEWKVKESEKEIKIHIWDFGGQEIMHATHQFFLSKRSLYILVLDGRKDEKTEYWLKHIESFGGDSPVLVVINKIDENPGFEVNRKFLREKYKNIRGFYRISCKTKKGIDAFVSALEKALSQIEMIKTTWAVNWFKVKTHLENMTEHYISYQKYLEICTGEKITEKFSQDTLVDFLNDLGVVLHFKDLYLEDTHVLEPKWVTEAVYKIINSEILAKCSGMLKLEFLEKILKQKDKNDYFYPPDKYKYIIQLMKKFELCYDIDRERVLIPDLLEVEEPSFDFDYGASLKFVLEYDFLPRSVMPRFILRMHRDIKENLQWRTGLFLEDKAFHSTAVVKEDERERKIFIYVTGEQKQYYFAVIRYTFRDINHSFEKLQVSERVPVPDDPAITVSYDHLLQLKKMNQKDYIPEGAKKAYNIDSLLHGFEENQNSSLAVSIKKRWAILKDFDKLIFNPETKEAEIHKQLENNLWILGTEYSKMSSNETLKKVVEQYLGKKYKGDSAEKRPDLLLTQDMGERYLLIELKKPGHTLDRKDEAQALEYRDELNAYLPNVKIVIIILGGQMKKTISSHNQRPDVKYMSYQMMISNARNNLQWLIDDLRKSAD